MQNSRPLGFKIGIHYAWIIIAIAAFMHMAGGSVRQAFGVLIVPLQDQLGWSAASITLGYALCSITGALLAPLTGIATDRYGAKPVIMAGITFFFLGAMVTGVVSQVWHIWISYGLLLGVAQACFNVPILTAASSWFHKRLGLGIGLLQASHGLGPAIMALMVSFLITSFEWRTAFWSIGIVGGCIMLGLILLFRSRPSDMGIRAYGAPESEPIFEKLDPVLEKLRSKAFRTSMQSTSAFWKLVSVHYLGCLGHSIVIIYVIPIAVIAGVDQMSAAGILTTLMAVSVLTRFATPVIADQLGAKWSMAIMFILQGLPVLMLFWTHELWQFYLFAVIFGIGYGGEGSAFPIINRQYFGRGPMGRSFGWQQAGAGAGMATGAWVGALLLGFFGAYDATIVLSTVASVAGALVLLSMEPTSRLLIPNWEDSVATQTSRPQPA